MEGKINNVKTFSKAMKRQKEMYPFNTAVIHNGSFMTEAFHSQSHETYEENEVVSIDACLPYTVFDSQPEPHSIHNITAEDQLALFGSCDSDTHNVSIHQPFSTVNVTPHDNSLSYDDHAESSSHLHVGNNLIHIDQSGIPSSKVLSHFDVDDSLMTDTGATVECTTSECVKLPSAVSSKEDNSMVMESLPTSVNMLSSSPQYIWQTSQHSDLNETAENVSQDAIEIQQGKDKSDICSLSNYGPPNQLTYINVAMQQKSSVTTFLPEIGDTDMLATDGSPVSKRPRISAIVGHNNVSTSTSLDSAVNQVEAFISLPSVASADVLPAAHTDTSLHILNSMESDGVIKVIDSNGRMYHIQQSHTQVMTTASNDLQHDLTATTSGTNVLPSVESNGHGMLTNGNFAQLPDDSASSSNKSGRSKKPKPNTITGKRRGGWPKGQKRKPERFRIKAPKTAYLLFAKKRRTELNQENSSYTFSEITVMMGREWTGLDPIIKEEYRKQADEDQTRFRAELKEYQQTDDYQKILKRKRDETTAKIGVMEDEDLGYVEEEFTLFCHICNQRFKSQHNRREHLAGRFHLKNLQAELRKQQQPEPTSPPQSCSGSGSDDPLPCCKHCVNRVMDLSVDTSFDINNQMETFLYKHSQRELELQFLRQNVKTLKEVNSQLSKDLITIQEKAVKLKQEIQANKQWQLQLTTRIDNLKMVPTLFGVINF